MISMDVFLPSIDPILDVISTIGVGIGLISAVYIHEIEGKKFPFWFPFVAIAVVFALLGAEGGALDVFVPGTFRIAALLSLITAELVAAYAAIQ